MKITILTLFPEVFSSPFERSIVKRALDRGLLSLDFVSLRNFGLGPHQTVDDRPYGGGVGMIIRVDVIDQALKKVKSQTAKGHLRGVRMHPSDGGGIGGRGNTGKIILLDPKGKLFNQRIARRFARLDHLILLCGHYEGVDERVKKLVDEVISIGEYVLTGGEIPAMVIVDSVTRLIPGVLAKKEATESESFTDDLLEAPHYTRPENYQGRKVPRLLLSGHHEKIRSWRQFQAKKLTEERKKTLALLK